MTLTRYNPALHTLALLTAAATFPLIFMGGLVTSHGAGMSVPDWPNTYGYNMFTFPPSKWVGGIFYEHTHRLMGTVVGMLSIALTIVAWRVEPRRWVRWLTAAVLVAVIVQGVLGGLRVVLVELDLAVVHACFAQAFFCLTALACVVTSRWWTQAPDRATSAHSGHLFRITITAVAVIYVQLIAGALMRHYGAGLAVPDLPLAYGQVLPNTDEAGLAAINAHRAWTWRLAPVTAAQVWLHLSHRLGALVVTAMIAWAVFVALRRHAHERAIRHPALALVALLLAQVTLGVLTVLWQKPADVASAHVAVGALLLVTTFVLAVRAYRLRPVAPAAEQAHATVHDVDRVPDPGFAEPALSA